MALNIDVADVSPCLPLPIYYKDVVYLVSYLYVFLSLPNFCVIGAIFGLVGGRVTFDRVASHHIKLHQERPTRRTGL